MKVTDIFTQLLNSDLTLSFVARTFISSLQTVDQHRTVG